MVSISNMSEPASDKCDKHQSDTKNESDQIIITIMNLKQQVIQFAKKKLKSKECKIRPPLFSNNLEHLTYRLVINLDDRFTGSGIDIGILMEDKFELKKYIKR